MVSDALQYGLMRIFQAQAEHRYWVSLQHLQKAVEKAGISREKGNHGFHLLRHSVGTLFYEESRDLKRLQGRLRHRDISTTSDIYVHLGDKVLREGTEILTDEILANCDLFATRETRMVSSVV